MRERSNGLDIVDYSVRCQCDRENTNSGASLCRVDSNTCELFGQLCLSFVLMLAVIGPLCSPLSAQPTWLFGRHAVIDWSPNPVSLRLWPDTSQTAPGILWDGSGRPILYKTETRFKWFGGDTVASNDTIPLDPLWVDAN